MPLELFGRLMQQLELESDHKTLCNMLAVSNTWRKYMLTHLAIKFKCVTREPSAPDDAGIRRVGGLVTWLIKHASMLQSIDISGKWPRSAYVNIRGVLGPLLGIRVDIATSKAAATVPTFSHLLAFSTDLPLGPFLVAAFVPSLTRLAFTDWKDDISSARMLDALARMKQLSNLQNLGLTAAGGDCVSEQYMAVLPSLKGLTALSVAGITSVPALPEQLQCLKLRYCQTYPYDGPTEPIRAYGIPLSGLTVLTRLELNAVRSLTKAVSLPASLRMLSIKCQSEVTVIQPWGVTALKQLQQLSVLGAADSNVQVASLSTVSGLQHIELGYNSVQSSAVAAPSWSSLAALQILSLRDWQDGSIQATLSCRKVCDQVTKLTALTKLEWFLGGNALRLPLEQLITGLTNLAVLVTRNNRLLGNNILHTTALGFLTCLEIPCIRADKSVAMQWANGMPQLQKLCIEQPISAVTVCAIEQLPSLTRLELGGPPGNEDLLVDIAERLSKLSKLSIVKRPYHL